MLENILYNSWNREAWNGHIRSEWLIARVKTWFLWWGRSDEDMTPMHMTMFGSWYGGEGGQQGFPSQEGGPRLIRFESPRWRPKTTQVRVCLGLQESLRTHLDSVFDDPHMVGKII